MTTSVLVKFLSQVIYLILIKILSCIMFNGVYQLLILFLQFSCTIYPPQALHAKYQQNSLFSFSRFTINLQEGTYPDCNVGLHLDVRFHFGSDTNVVVRNHRSGGNWGPEERDVPYFPFAPNASFEMLILCDANCFKVKKQYQWCFLDEIMFVLHQHLAKLLMKKIIIQLQDSEKKSFYGSFM